MTKERYNNISLLVSVLALLVLTFAVYGGILHHSFLNGWDDDRYVTANRAVQGINFGNLKTAFTSVYVGNYAPLQIISYMVDYALWGHRAAGFLLTNLLLHAVNGLLYFALVWRLTKRYFAAFVAAFVFLLHPVQVESVAWISQRKNLLAMFFFLVALYAWSVWRDRAGRSGRLLYLVSLGAFCCAVLSKSVAVILPLVLLFYEFCFVPKERRRGLVSGILPFFLVSIVAAAANVVVQDPNLGVGGGRAPWHGGSPLATLYTMLPVFVRYLGILFWPTKLSAFYDPPVRTHIDEPVILAALLLICLMASLVFLWRKERRLFFWAALFCLGLLPVSQVVPLVTLMNDRYLYFPLLGVAALAGIFLARLADVVSGKMLDKRVAAGLLLVFLLPLPYLAFERTKVWDNSLTLWSDTADKTPSSKWAWIGLAEVYRDRGMKEEAIATYKQVFAMDPASVRALVNLGRLYGKCGQISKGREYLMQGVKLYPGYAPIFVALGENYSLAGEWSQAAAALEKAKALDPHADGLELMIEEIKTHSGG